MSQIIKRFKINGVLTNMTSVVLESPSAPLYGVKRLDTGAIVVAAGVAMVNDSPGVYSYTFTDPAYDLHYQYYVKFTYGGQIYYVQGNFDGPVDPTIPTDDAYATITEGNEYCKQRLNSTAWTNATTTEKTQALIMASKAIDKLNLRGEKTDEAQTLEFPRYDDTSVPDDIKFASIEIAIALLDDIDPDIEFKNLRLISQSYASVRSSYDVNNVPEHILAGIPSIVAWRYLLPYLEENRVINTRRIS